MKFTNKILDIITSSVMKKVEKKREEFKNSEEYAELEKEVKEKYDYEENLALLIAHENAEKAYIEASNLRDEKRKAYQDAIIATVSYNGRSWSIPTGREGFENLYTAKAMEGVEFPSKEDIQTAIIFENNSDVKEVEEAVCKQYNL